MHSTVFAFEILYVCTDGYIFVYVHVCVCILLYVNVLLYVCIHLYKHIQTLPCIDKNKIKSKEGALPVTIARNEG